MKQTLYNPIELKKIPDVNSSKYDCLNKHAR